MLNNVIGIALVAVASRAPDEDHPYGHDKFETLGALGIVGFLSISCFELLREGISAAGSASRADSRSTPGDVGIIAANAGRQRVRRLVRARARDESSAARFCSPTHRTRAGDIFVTLLALASLVSRDGARVARCTAGDRASRCMIAWSGVGILRQSIPILVDERAIEAKALRSVVLPFRHPGRAQDAVAFDRIGSAIRRGHDRRRGRDVGRRRAPIGRRRGGSDRAGVRDVGGDGAR